MIIGQFNDSFPPIMDGVANVTRNYAYWLHQKHGTCYVVTPAFPGYQDQETFEVIRYFSLPLLMRRPYRLRVPYPDYNLSKKLRAIPFSLVHAHSPFSSGRLALRVARARGIPIVATFHSKFYDDFRTVVRSDKLAQIGVKHVVEFFNAVDAVWTVNETTVETLREYGYRGKVEVVNNGIDFIPLNDREPRRQEINERLHLSPHENMLLFVGQHIWQKNVKLLIKALKYLQDWGFSFKMVFVGTGYAKEAMQEQVKNLGLAQQTIFMGNLQDRELLRSLYARADLFLFPSLYDTAAIVVREAAAAQCPAVVIEKANCAEGLIDGVNSFQSANDPESFANTIKEALSDRRRLQQVGEEAQRTLYRHWEQVVDEVALKYQELIDRFQQKKKVFRVSSY